MTSPHTPYHSAVITAAVFLVALAVNIQMPLYQTYAHAAGWGHGPVAVVFACYVAALLPMLIFLGGISDRVGRKPVIITGLLLSATATTMVIIHPTIRAVMFARAFQGLSVGLSVSAGTAWLAQTLGGSPADAARAAGRIAIATSIGFGGGALLTTVTLLGAVPALVPPSYWITLTVAIAVTILAFRLPDVPVPGGPLLRLPHFPHGTVAAGFAISFGWAISGLVIAVLPAEMTRHAMGIWAGPSLFLVTATGTLFQPMVRKMHTVKAIRVGLLLLPLGYGLLVAGAGLGNVFVLITGAIVIGAACYGFTYFAGLAQVAAAGGIRRASAVSGYFLFAYLGFSLPSIALGYVADRTGTLTALVGFGVVITIGCLSLAHTFRPTTPK